MAIKGKHTSVNVIDLSGRCRCIWKPSDAVTKRRTTCPDCDGTGEVELLTSVAACDECEGRGWVEVVV